MLYVQNVNTAMSCPFLLGDIHGTSESVFVVFGVWGIEVAAGAAERELV